MHHTMLIPVINTLDVDQSGLPKEVKLFPLGLVKSQKGDFLVDEVSYNSILNHFKAHGVDIPIDYEHQTLQDVQAPAAGWIKNLTLKTDGVYAAVEWTTRAAQYLTEKEYRYLSPVVNVQQSDRRALMLHSAALTNTPAIDGMTAIVNSTKYGKPAEMQMNGEDEETGKPSTESSGEGVEDPNAFINGLRQMLQLPDDASLADIEEHIAGLLQGRDELKLEVNSLRFEAHKSKAEEAVLTALKTGKIMPFQKDWAFNHAMSHIDAFKNWVDNAPQVVPMGEIVFETLAHKAGNSCSRAHELLGLTADDVKRYGGGSL